MLRLNEMDYPNHPQALESPISASTVETRRLHSLRSGCRANRNCSGP